MINNVIKSFDNVDEDKEKNIIDCLDKILASNLQKLLNELAKIESSWFVSADFKQKAKDFETALNLSLNKNNSTTDNESNPENLQTKSKTFLESINSESTSNEETKNNLNWIKNLLKSIESYFTKSKIEKLKKSIDIDNIGSQIEKMKNTYSYSTKA